MKILVTGGAGYIGSHTLIELAKAGHSVSVVDNLSRGHAEAVRRAEKIANTKIDLYVGDICDLDFLLRLMSDNSYDAVIHFAGLKSVEESMYHPEKYYMTNVCGTSRLCEAMRMTGVDRIVFSSSATVYGHPSTLPITETADLRPINPYGSSKKSCEELLTWFARNANWSVMLLRYFNPVGAHDSGLIGEFTTNPANLMPIVVRAAAGLLKEVVVYGDNYDTPDGTCVRDYIHVVDLARAHVAALDQLSNQRGLSIYNIGTGKGLSVLEVIDAVSTVSGKRINYRIGARRPGDASSVFADASLAKKELAWTSKYSLDQMAETAWKWQALNPHGYL